MLLSTWDKGLAPGNRRKSASSPVTDFSKSLTTVGGGGEGSDLFSNFFVEGFSVGFLSLVLPPPFGPLGPLWCAVISSCFSLNWSISLASKIFSSGSQVEYFGPHPCHLTRYSTVKHNCETFLENIFHACFDLKKLINLVLETW